MLVSTPLLVRASQQTPQVITCSITDRFVERFSISVAFFYREKLSYKLLIVALEKVLIDFPIFSGRLKRVNNDLLIDCNNEGVQFSFCFENGSLVQALEDLSQTNLKKLVDPLIAKDVLAGQSPVLTIRFTQFDCEGTALGICWHHSLGDMHTFMRFMKAWSATVNGEKYAPPLVAKDRHSYFQRRITRKEKASSSVRYLKLEEWLRLTCYMITTGRQKTSIKIYFSDNEIENMKRVFSRQARQALSRNDVLCAHLFGLITDLDNYKEDRCLAIALNYRNRTGLSQGLLGNLIDTVDIVLPQDACPFVVAQAIRKGIENFETEHLSVMSTHRYVEDNGGVRKIQRFVSRGVDPMRRSILMTNWSKFGVYDISFLEANPLYFTSVDDLPVPWICTIVEGFSNQGLICSAHLPAKLVQKLKQPNMLKRLHQYRDPKETHPSQIENLAWLY
ncbi:acyltransferase [cf. Phormidesmis sp. LEGE 11477]|uniref:acyltransferase n=1 Tax=cf. Phormidesmis sp. LEGE 11477 TaxID=1828680 RepID=UPI00187EE382|nr:acyltransferase [cf. Phormidesmis sp. LEGE 11477]MBE9060501.1 vinorine synthase [cf. Phormidesmis sp. LEGE 11477]